MSSSLRFLKWYTSYGLGKKQRKSNWNFSIYFKLHFVVVFTSPWLEVLKKYIINQITKISYCDIIFNKHQFFLQVSLNSIIFEISSIHFYNDV